MEVLIFLITTGVDNETISYQGYGSSLPVNSNETDQGRAKNRRIELVILK